MDQNAVSLPTTLAALVTVAPLLSALIVATTFLVGLRFQKRSKSIDVMSDCRKRFDAMQYDFKPKVPKDISIEQYSRRFWELQNEQFVLWQDGFISDATFKFWLQRRAAEQARKFVDGDSRTTQDSWNATKDYLESPEFVALMDGVFLDGYRAAFDEACRQRRRRRTRVAALVLGGSLAAVLALMVLAANFDRFVPYLRP